MTYQQYRDQLAAEKSDHAMTQRFVERLKVEIIGLRTQIEAVKSLAGRVAQPGANAADHAFANRVLQLLGEREEFR